LAVELVVDSLVIGIRIGAPVAVALLLANLITALLARTVPQINILAVGFNINAMVMLIMIFASVGGIGFAFQEELANWLQYTSQLWDSSASI
jgi:flagellar biosynthetic protein FliR